MKSSGADTYSANMKLGFDDDHRDYTECKVILEYLKVTNFTLLTGNPDKIKAMESFTFDTSFVLCGLCDTNKAYLTSKAKKHGLFALPDSRSDTNGKRVCIIHAMWYENYITPFVDELACDLAVDGSDIYKVPGCFEIPRVAKKLAEQYDCIVVVGVIIKGETYHFECLSNSITNALMTIQLDTGKPIVDGILSVYSVEQMVERLQSAKAMVDTTKMICGSV